MDRISTDWYPSIDWRPMDGTYTDWCPIDGIFADWCPSIDWRAMDGTSTDWCPSIDWRHMDGISADWCPSIDWRHMDGTSTDWRLLDGHSSLLSESRSLWQLLAGWCRHQHEMRAFYIVKDVFKKNRDPLVKLTLTTQLYNTLDLLGLRDFLESHKEEHGYSFSSIIKIAIHSAKVHLAICSKRSRCLPDHVDLLKMAELIRMLESNCKSIPVFYHEELQKFRHRNCQMSKNPVGQGLKEFKRGRFGQLVQNLEKQCTLQGKKRRKP